MPAPVNMFKKALLEGQAVYGLWVGLANPHAAEICAGAGFDWVLIDGEHAPNDIPMIAGQLQAVSAQPAHAVVRVPVGESWLIKQALDIGAQTLMLPMVETAEQAAQLVRACRYPPHGIRGVGASLGRASDFGRVSDYTTTADEQICIVAQIESVSAVENIEEIAAVEGVDVLFIGPADLAADMGHYGDVSVPDVMALVEKAIKTIVGLGKPAGIMTTNTELQRRAKAAGATMLASESDVGLLMRAAAAHCHSMKG